MIIPPIIVHCGIGILTTAFSVPLALRKVPMNCWYGVRIPKAFKSEHNWYEINAYGGKLFLLYGLLLTLFGLIGRDFTPSSKSAWFAVFIVGPLLGVFPVLALIFSFARRLPDR